MRRPFIASLDHPAPGTAKSGQPHRDTAEKRRDLMFAVVFHATNVATDRAIRPASNGVLPSLSGNERLLQTRQHQLSFGHRQPQIGEIANTARTDDLQDVGTLLLTIGLDFDQPHSPSHASIPISTKLHGYTVIGTHPQS